MKPGFWDYVKAAFSARPIGMFIPPNWVGLALFGVLGFMNPGFWIMGAGLELGYLYILSTHPRFRRIIAATRSAGERRVWEEKLRTLTGQLDSDDQRRYRTLEHRCREIMDQQGPADKMGGGSVEVQVASGLGRLLWIYLRLLLARQGIDRMLHEASISDMGKRGLTDRVKELENRLKDQTLGEDLRKSLAGQLEIVKQRIERQREAKEKLGYLDAELERIREQVELIREQTLLPNDPQTVSDRIDQITATLGGTTQWVREQQKMYGKVEDLMEESPPILAPTPVEERP